MTFRPGDRIRMEQTGDDGFPLVRYGFVSGAVSPDGPWVVMLDGELSCITVHGHDIAPVQVTTIELTLPGRELFENAHLRTGLVAMWQAEAEQAGLAVDAVHPFGEPLGSGLRDAGDSYTLAELVAGGEQYVVRAVTSPLEPGMVRVRADRPNRWDW